MYVCKCECVCVWIVLCLYGLADSLAPAFLVSCCLQPELMMPKQLTDKEHKAYVSQNVAQSAKQHKYTLTHTQAVMPRFIHTCTHICINLHNVWLFKQRKHLLNLA